MSTTYPDSQVRIYSDEEIQTFLKDDALDDETLAVIHSLHLDDVLSDADASG